MDFGLSGKAGIGVSISGEVGGAGFGVGAGASASASADQSVTGDAEAPRAEAEMDSDGYRIEQRTETEEHSQTEEVRELDDNRGKETHRHQIKEVRVEEVKSRESEPRPATADEIRAILGAEFSGGPGAEIQTSHEITVEEFTRVERKHEKTDSGTGETETETTTTEARKTEATSEQPQWKTKTITASPEPQAEVEASVPGPEQSISLPITFVDAQGNVDIPLPQVAGEVSAPSVAVSSQAAPKPAKSKGGGIFGKFKLTSKEKDAKEDDMPGVAAEVDVAGGVAVSLPQEPDISGQITAEPMDVSAEASASASGSVEWPNKHHKVKHKRHIIEEVVLEDCDKFYEEQHRRPKLFVRSKAKADKENVEPTVERRRSTGELPLPVIPETGLAADVSNEELLKFVVQYDLPADNLDENVPKGRKRWTMPIFTKSNVPEDNGSGEPTAEKKRKTGDDKQDEVVVEDEDIFTDTSLERKGFRFRKKKKVPTATLR